jgi:deoxyribose-phosphate aldolase
LKAELAASIDLALWDPTAGMPDIERLCAVAREKQFRSVCVNGSRVELAYARLEETTVKVVALVGFPLGAMDADAKRFELETAIDQGAQEIEVVLNVGRLKDGESGYVLRELRDLAEAAEERPVCVALETASLTRNEIVAACQLALDSGVTAISNATGFFGNAPPSFEEIRFLRQTLGARFGLKAAPFTDGASAQSVLEAGANRLGLLHPRL